MVQHVGEAREARRVCCLVVHVQDQARILGCRVQILRRTVWDTIIRGRKTSQAQQQTQCLEAPKTCSWCVRACHACFTGTFRRAVSQPARSRSHTRRTLNTWYKTSHVSWGAMQKGTSLDGAAPGSLIKTRTCTRCWTACALRGSLSPSVPKNTCWSVHKRVLELLARHAYLGAWWQSRAQTGSDLHLW